MGALKVKKGITMSSSRKDIISRDYVQFLSEIKSRIVSARVQASRSINKELIQLYWDIGKSIIERQEKYGWGQSVVEKLAVDLTAEFDGAEGYSVQNLWRMRFLYLAYKDNPKLAQLVREIPWGQNIVILQMVKDAKEREYYIRATAEMGWSRNVLMNQIKAGAYRYQKTISKQHNFPKALPAHLAEQADESLKSAYNLDFLDIKRPVLERELERRLVEKIKRFMLELGRGFSFIGNQYRLTLKDNEYFVVNPMGVAEYRLTAHPPKELKALLPSEREMKAQLQTEFIFDGRGDVSI